MGKAYKPCSHGSSSFGAQRLDRLDLGGVVGRNHPGERAEHNNHTGRCQRDAEVGVGMRKRSVGELLENFADELERCDPPAATPR